MNKIWTKLLFEVFFYAIGAFFIKFILDNVKGPLNGIMSTFDILFILTVMTIFRFLYLKKKRI